VKKTINFLYWTIPSLFLFLIQCNKRSTETSSESVTLSMGGGQSSPTSQPAGFEPMVQPPDGRDALSKQIQEELGVLPYYGPPHLAMEWLEYAVRLSPKLRQKFVGYEEKYGINRFEFLTVALGEGLSWTPNFYDEMYLEIPKEDEDKIKNFLKLPPIQGHERAPTTVPSTIPTTSTQMGGPLFLVQQGEAQDPPGVTLEPTQEPENLKKLREKHSCPKPFQPIPPRWRDRYKVWGYGTLGTDYFSSEYKDLVSEGLLSSSFQEGREFVCAQVKNEKNETAYSALFSTLDMALDAFAAMYARRLKLAERDVKELGLRWDDGNSPYSAPYRKTYWTYRYYLTGANGSRKLLEKNRSTGFTKGQAQEDGRRPKDPRMKCMKRLATMIYLNKINPW
jgi:hypothetical protein